MSFKVEAQFCGILKSVQPLVKAQNTSISASQKNQTVTFSLFNSDTNILVHHQLNQQKVEAAQKFAVFTDRLVSLVSDRGSAVIDLNFDGSALNYRYRKSTGRVETHRYDAHDRPQIQKDKVLTNLARKYFGLLSLKTVVDNTEGYVFIEEEAEQTKLIVSDDGGYHAVMITIPTKNEVLNSLAIPLNYVQSAIRVLKENINICNDEEYLYCYTRESKAVSIIRFRNMVNTGTISAAVITEAINSKNEFRFTAPATLFDDILKDYKVIEDKERGGTIVVTLKDGGIVLTAETRHGSCKSEPDIKTKIKETYSFGLPTKVLPDILRLKGEVKMGMKDGRNIFFMEQREEENDMKITYMCTAERMNEKS